ncbi:MAG: hypothetical protein A2X08_16825 [Bacteroidetes bacterium GWA2_32_17]|nr:MAG: hypothetical protein A2X08_16825 [Bacteroidetes bacterium GWA2_32_17]
MINNTKILVINKSDIILLGLNDLLKNSLSNEIIYINSADELENYPHLMGYIIVLISENDFYQNKALINKQLKNATKIAYLFIELNSDKISANTINIYENADSITNKINELLSSFKRNISNKNELSKREIEVLKLLTKGLSNKEIAQILFISTYTVISHRKNISEKTKIKSTSGLTIYAIINKIVNIEEISTSELI